MESVDLNKIPVQETEGHTSKGNQLKWKLGDQWYKADHNRQKISAHKCERRFFRLIVLRLATYFPNILSIISSTHSGLSMVYTFFSSR